MKKLLIALLLALSLSVGVQAAQEEIPEALEEYDDYYQFENDYNNSVVVDDISGYSHSGRLFAPAIIGGAVLGGAVTYAFLRHLIAPPAPDFYLRKPKEEHEITEK